MAASEIGVAAMKRNEELAQLCAGECPFGYDCRAVDCEECAKIRAETEDV